MRNNPIHIPTVKKIFENFYPNACGFKKSCTFATHLRNKPTAKAKRLIKNDQMAELVDALVSNTSGFTSMPVRSRLWVQGQRISSFQLLILLFF